MSNLGNVGNSNSNWTFIALNLLIQEDSKEQQNLKAVDKISVSRDMSGGQAPRRTPGDDPG